MSPALILAVDPVPWARAQMAFTLASHIILVPLGVSWACMTLVANWKAIKHGDQDASLLAQRWSKYMAVTFAVGAVTMMNAVRRACINSRTSFSVLLRASVDSSRFFAIVGPRSGRFEWRSSPCIVGVSAADEE